MGKSKTFSQEIESPVAPARLFKALCLEHHVLFPKLMPDSFASIEFVEGDSVKVGSIQQLNFPEGYHFKYAQHKTDELDVDNFYCKYTTIDGDVLQGKNEFVVNETKFDATATGSICKMTTVFHPVEGVEINEEGVKFGQEKMKKMFKIVEEYLVANPEIYA
ncbi:Major strawberry allergen Fra a 1-3-like protein [Drosera capensis]